MPDATTSTLRTSGPERTRDEGLVRVVTDHPPQGPGTATQSSPVPPPCVVARRWEDEVDWQAWFRNLGRQARALRELLRLSQYDLAALAGVSQGSVSRFERGSGQCTSAIVLLRIAVALARRCRAEHPATLAEPLARIMDDLEALAPVTAARLLPTVTHDPREEQLHVLFRAVPPRARDAVVSILRSFCTIAGSDRSA